MVYPDMSNVIDLVPQLAFIEKAMHSDAYPICLTAKCFGYLPETDFSTCNNEFIAILYRKEIRETCEKWNATAGSLKKMSLVIEGIFEEVSFDEFRAKVYTFFSYYAEDLLL